MKYLRRELKVCEGCGGLWVRTGAKAGVYCRTCSALLADLPGRRRRSPGRPCTVHGAARVRLEVVAAAATGGQPGTPRGRCVRTDAEEQRTEEQRMEETAAERRAAMALVGFSGPSDVPDACAGAVPAMRKPVGRAVPADALVAVAMVGGAR